MRIDLGSYTYLFNEKTGESTSFQYNYPWRDTTGDNLLLAMATRIKELEADIASNEAYLENWQEANM
jgi:hypothetical protein